MSRAGTLTSVPATSWWYGQGRAVDCTRRLESLAALPHPPGPAGVITVGRESLTVTFVDGLRSPLPPPWEPAGRESRLPLSLVAAAAAEPDPAHPVYLVVLGSSNEDMLVVLNLAAFARIRFAGDATMTRALVVRWILELVSTHPATTIGVSADVWSGPATERVRPVSAGDVPDVDVLVLGAQLSYAERAQILGAARSPILLDLGADAAVSATWVVSCDANYSATLANTALSTSTPLQATVFVPAAETIEACAGLLTTPTPAAQPSTYFDDGELPVTRARTPSDGGYDDGGYDDSDEAYDDPGFTDGTDGTDGTDDADDAAAPRLEPDHPVSSPPPAPADIPVPTTSAPMLPEQPVTGPPAPADPAPIPASAARADDLGDDLDAAAAGVSVSVIWNRILGQIELCPPHGGPAVPDREKRLNELLVYLQWRPWATSEDIIADVYGAASDKTLQQQVSLLRSRLGVIRPGGPKALPPLRDGRYTPDAVVRSDWQEFERLVEILVETTPTPRLVAAMALVTGRPLGGIGAKEWAWAAGLRDEIRSRVPQTAVVLAERLHTAGRYHDAAAIARKGLWFDTARQDLWRIAMMAALDGRDRDAYRNLRSQYLAEIPAEDRDTDVHDLTKRG